MTKVRTPKLKKKDFRGGNKTWMERHAKDDRSKMDAKMRKYKTLKFIK